MRLDDDERDISRAERTGVAGLVQGGRRAEGPKLANGTQQRQSPLNEPVIHWMSAKTSWSSDGYI